MQTPAQVAKRANVTAQSIRNYTDRYGELLSPQARGEAGPRLFSDEDVDTLCAIALMRKAGVPPDEVVDRIRNGSAPTVIDVTLNASLNEALNPPQNGLKTGQEARLALADVQPMLLARFEAIERRLDGKARGDMLWHIGTGVWLGIVFSGFVLWVVWLVVG